MNPVGSRAIDGVLEGHEVIGVVLGDGEGTIRLSKIAPTPTLPAHPSEADYLPVSTCKACTNVHYALGCMVETLVRAKLPACKGAHRC